MLAGRQGAHGARGAASPGLPQPLHRLPPPADVGRAAAQLSRLGQPPAPRVSLADRCRGRGVPDPPVHRAPAGPVGQPHARLGQVADPVPGGRLQQPPPLQPQARGGQGRASGAQQDGAAHRAGATPVLRPRPAPGPLPAGEDFHGHHGPGQPGLCPQSRACVRHPAHAGGAAAETGPAGQQTEG